MNQLNAGTSREAVIFRRLKEGIKPPSRWYSVYKLAFISYFMGDSKSLPG